MTDCPEDGPLAAQQGALVDAPKAARLSLVVGVADTSCTRTSL